MTSSDSCSDSCSDSVLFGLSADHLSSWDQHHFVHPQAFNPLLALTDAAANAGFELKFASSFRSFDRQLTIFNNKYLGHRTLLDLQGQEINAADLAPWPRCQAILLYSALPGASRHHWGTDVDFYDQSAIPADYQLKLTSDEYRDNGPFAPLCQWLLQHAAEYDFFFPYQHYNQGVANEPWHLSYFPLANQRLKQLTPNRLRQQLQNSTIVAKDVILAHLDEIFDCYINNINDANR